MFTVGAKCGVSRFLARMEQFERVLRTLSESQVQNLALIVSQVPNLLGSGVGCSTKEYATERFYRGERGGSKSQEEVDFHL